MIDDCGGVSHLAAEIGCARTTPYRWIKQGSLSSRTLESIKLAFPALNVDDYFEGHDDAATGERHA
jgi:predicted site-specific integrase-resolvase